jgi:hypothetical protein
LVEGVCVSVARDAAALQAAGKSPRQIREAIEQRYGELGPGTPTPWPPQ